eukprot:m.58753 g.58753  ORF g.58753 m.58753 type:complete len:100 (-) comp11281_c0_seq3:662-961(-)
MRTCKERTFSCMQINRILRFVCTCIDCTDIHTDACLHVEVAVYVAKHFDFIFPIVEKYNTPKQHRTIYIVRCQWVQAVVIMLPIIHTTLEPFGQPFSFT